MLSQKGNIKAFLIMIFAACMLVVSAGITGAAANDHTSVWVPGDNLQGFFAGSNPGGDSSPEACQVRRKFYDFCNRWIGNKNDYAIKNVQIKKTGSCSVKEYSQCGDAYELKITKAPGSTVYVGTLKYMEKVFRTDASGTSEKFALAQEVPVTEFFMFKNGKWVY